MFITLVKFNHSHRLICGVEQLKGAAKGVTSLQQYIQSPLFQHTLHSGPALGIEPAQTVKDLAEGVATAVSSAGISTMTSMASPDAKLAAARKSLQESATLWPQFAEQNGIKYTEGFGSAIIAEATRQVESKFTEEKKQYDSDRMKYMASVKDGPAGPGGMPAYRDPMAHAIENALDPRRDPSVLSIFNKMSNGKTAFENAQRAGATAYASDGPHADVVAFQKDQLEDQKNRLLQTRDPSKLEDYFKQLNTQNASTAQKQAYLQQLHTIGGLPQPYIDALNLHTAPERAARWSQLMAGSGPVQEFTKSQEGETDKTIAMKSFQNNSQLYSNLALKFGPNSPQLTAARSEYDQAWQSDYAGARLRGLGEKDAAAQANQMREKTVGAWGVAGASHGFFGAYTSAGPQVPVEYGKPDYSIEQKKNINDNLVRFQSEAELKKYEFVPVPGAAPPNSNAPTSASWIADHAALWERSPSGDGYRLRVREMSSSGQPTGDTQPVQIQSQDGKKRYYEVKDRDVLPPVVK